MARRRPRAARPPCRGPSRAAGRRRRASSRRSPRPARRAARPSSGPPPARRRRRPRARRRRGGSAACSDRVPVTSDGTLCIHELFERTWRRLTSTSPASRRSSRAARRGDVGHDVVAARARPCATGVASTSSSRGASGPMSTPFGCAFSAASVSPPGFAPYASPHGPVRIWKSSSRSGPTPSVAATISAGSRPWIREPGSCVIARDEAGEEELVERARVDRVGIRALAGSRRAASRISHSCGPRARVEERAASTCPRCAPPRTRSARRSAAARAARGPAGSRRRGASSRSASCRCSP